jgi:hypothetical protein
MFVQRSMYWTEHGSIALLPHPNARVAFSCSVLHLPKNKNSFSYLAACYSSAIVRKYIPYTPILRLCLLFCLFAILAQTEGCFFISFWPDNPRLFSLSFSANYPFVLQVMFCSLPILFLLLSALFIGTVSEGTVQTLWDHFRLGQD